MIPPDQWDEYRSIHRPLNTCSCGTWVCVNCRDESWPCTVERMVRESGARPITISAYPDDQPSINV